MPIFGQCYNLVNIKNVYLAVHQFRRKSSAEAKLTNNIGISYIWPYVLRGMKRILKNVKLLINPDFLPIQVKFSLPKIYMTIIMIQDNYIFFGQTLPSCFNI